MFRTNGQLIGSRHKLSTDILVGTACMFQTQAKYRHPCRQCREYRMYKNDDVHDKMDSGGRAKQEPEPRMKGQLIGSRHKLSTDVLWHSLYVPDTS